VRVLHVGGRGGGKLRLLICDGQGLDDGDAIEIAENLNKFKRLHKLKLVSWGNGGEGGEVVGVRM
jgi:hypothetical protein